MIYYGVESEAGVKRVPRSIQAQDIRRCRTCGVPVMYFKTVGTQSSPFGVIPKHETIYLDNYGLSPRDYRCKKHVDKAQA